MVLIPTLMVVNLDFLLIQTPVTKALKFYRFTSMGNVLYDCKSNKIVQPVVID